MSDMVRMSPEDFAALGDQMRMANTQRLKAVLDALEPYIDGSLGPVSPTHVNSYVKTVRELGLLWRSYDRPGQVEQAKGSDEELMILGARQEAVLAELDKLAAIGARRGRAS